MMPKTLGGDAAHVYVTRAATLQYQEIAPGRPQFETARLELTRRLLSARCVDHKGAYQTTRLRAYVQREGQLLIVTKVEPNPLRLSARRVYSRGPDQSPTSKGA